MDTSARCLVGARFSLRADRTSESHRSKILSPISAAIVRERVAIRAVAALVAACRVVGQAVLPAYRQSCRYTGRRPESYEVFKATVYFKFVSNNFSILLYSSAQLLA